MFESDNLIICLICIGWVGKKGFLSIFWFGLGWVGSGIDCIVFHCIVLYGGINGLR